MIAGRRPGEDAWALDERHLVLGLSVPSRSEEFHEVLSPDERARLDRIRSPGTRTEIASSRVLLRTLLSRTALSHTTLSQTGTVDPADWRFGASPTGRPLIVEPEEYRGVLSFSLSHTQGLVGCAIARQEEVGLDLEPVSRSLPAEDLARRFYSATEFEALAALAPPARGRRFLEIWTLKESHLKARGLGIASGLERQRFEISADSIVFETDDELDAAGWQFRLGESPTGHLVAVSSRFAGAVVLGGDSEVADGLGWFATSATMPAGLESSSQPRS